MLKRLSIAALFPLMLAACATAPDTGEDMADKAEPDPEGLTCTVDREVGSPRDPAKICRD